MSRLPFIFFLFLLFFIPYFLFIYTPSSIAHLPRVYSPFVLLPDVRDFHLQRAPRASSASMPPHVNSASTRRCTLFPPHPRASMPYPHAISFPLYVSALCCSTTPSVALPSTASTPPRVVVGQSRSRPCVGPTRTRRNR
jgi:hypothetical protein